MRLFSLFVLLSTVVACNLGSDGQSEQQAPASDDPSSDNPDNPDEVSRTVPLYGGTMAVQGNLMVAADPGRDRIAFWNVAASDFTEVELAAGSEPFRVAFLDNMAVVTLRRSGAIATFDPENATEVGRTEVCPAPRGVAVDGATVYVACASGELVTLDRNLTVTNSWHVGYDLRDVVVENGNVWLSTFRSAQVLRVDPTSQTVLATHSPDLANTHQHAATPTTAWRLRADPHGGVVMLHQSASNEPIALNDDEFPGDEEPFDTGGRGGHGDPYGGDQTFCFPGEDVDFQVSGSRNPGLVNSHLTFVSIDGLVRTTGVVSGAVLSVDLAVDPTGESYLLTTNAFNGEGMILRTEGDLFFDNTCVGTLFAMSSQGLSTSVGFSASGEMVGFGRSPSAFFAERGRQQIQSTGSRIERDAQILFHSNAGAGIACASCHPEGQDDGHVWQFETLGARRTQNLSGGLMARAPFHWDGEFETLGNLMDDVFSQRMGGHRLNDSQHELLGAWLDKVDPVRVTPQASAEQIAAGQEIFEDPAVGCASCHFGADLSDHSMHTVVEGAEPTKTPSLLGVGSRAPFMHTGCAPTLEARFTDPTCGGGDLHGTTSQLSQNQINALAAYLRTL